MGGLTLGLGEGGGGGGVGGDLLWLTSTPTGSTI
jgi:hypothetical protein